MRQFDHSPTPWEIKDISDRVKDQATIWGVFGPSEIIAGPDGIAVPDRFNDRTFPEDRANMAFIVTAANAYEANTALIAKLTEALEQVVSEWNSLPEGDYSPMRVQHWLVGAMAPAIASARVTLSLAKSETPQ